MTATEQYGYDELQRLLSASRSWTGMTPSPSTSLGDTYAYDDLGNITKKSDYADAYTYGNTGRTVGLAGPHAVSSVSVGGVPKASFAYDANGNLVSGDGRTITFDNLDRPVTVTMAGFTAQFRYAPDGNRYVQSTTGPASSQEYYFDKLYELVESAQAPTDRTYVNNAVMIVRTGSVRAVRYRHLDRLGSLDAVTKEDASEDPADAHGYDAFGKPRARDWQSSSDQLQPNIGSYTTERGFTGHEHLDSLYLIHMNGRVYDYRLGRFLSVDPIISNPANSQSINPYSYIGNNPLSGTDPTGYECEGKQPATGSHVCGSTITNSSSPGFINGDPAVPGLNRPMQKKSGAETQGAATKTGPTADNGNPAATAQTNTTPRYDGGSLAQPSSTTTPGDWARALERKTGELLSNADLNMGGASEGAILSKHVLPGLLFGWLHLGEGIAAATSDPTLTPLQRLIAAVSDVTLVAGAVLPRIGSGSAGTVYRGLAAEEEAAAGLVARAPTAGNSIASHVAGQRASQWISTTKSLEVATSRFGQNGIVAIDLSKVSGEVVDLSQGIPGLPPSYMLSRWAIGSQEVLIQGSVPAEAITVIK